jgi:hypothetical protein
MAAIKAINAPPHFVRQISKPAQKYEVPAILRSPEVF